ncbi:CapA family protein [Anaerococcus porci]|uniref:CapA family protein n=1 Tax=Anaerococcus porci TaxID=2652269 RepID=UPI002A75E94D|nr:CapA family protein [Anaerococcus porci]MDY3006752.1 CapA family protein [Anaerococcus porci]
MRISFTGDIMCELPTLRKSKVKNSYNFQGMLSKSNIFGKTDYLVGNLETVFAGKNAKYSNDIYSYNTPDSFINEVSKAGFDLVTTANNHCLDRGKEGLIRTIKVLKDNNINYIGTNINDTDDRYRIIDFDGLKIGFMSYTYGSNYSINKNKLDLNDQFMVNYFEKQDWVDNSRKDLYSKFKDNIISAENRVKILKLLNRKYNKPRVDNTEIKDLDENLIIDIMKLKKSSDIIVFLMHSGGQFNVEPGIYTTKLVNNLRNNGIKIIIGTHPHIVQKYVKINDFFVAYSLGNYFISPDTIYLINDNLPLYSIVLHMDIVSLNKYNWCFSIAKIINDNEKEKVVDTYDLYNSDSSSKIQILNDCRTIYQTFTGKITNDFKMHKEYEI